MKKIITTIGIVLLMGALAYPVLAWGPGWGGMQGGMGTWGGPGYCWRAGTAYGSLTPDQQAQLDQLRQKFYNETADLRSQLWAKRGELNSLLTAQNPDQNRVRELQNEINDLRAQLSQKRLDFQLEAKKIAPNAGPGAGWGGPGYGRHKGYHGGRPCWN